MSPSLHTQCNKQNAVVDNAVTQQHRNKHNRFDLDTVKMTRFQQHLLVDQLQQPLPLVVARHVWGLLDLVPSVTTGTSKIESHWHGKCVCLIV